MVADYKELLGHSISNDVSTFTDDLLLVGANQRIIVEEGGISTLFDLGRRSTDTQTQKMVGGAVANICGNSK